MLSETVFHALVTPQSFCRGVSSSSLTVAVCVDSTAVVREAAGARSPQ